ncbi:MAG: hypothetical protein ACR2Q4_12335 [Geminicoccaceae bacterium]
MRNKSQQLRKRLTKKAKRGFRGFPVATLATYGPDDQMATKLVASIIEQEDAEPSVMRKWFATDDDVRHDPEILTEVTDLLAEHNVLSVAMLDRIIGCPHEEGIDYTGPTCPECPFWANRDRWTGDIVH